MKWSLPLDVLGLVNRRWARKTCKEFKDYRNVNSDDLRMALFGLDKHQDYRFNKTNEKLVTDVQENAAFIALAHGKNVINSDTNLKAERREFWRGVADKHNAVLSGLKFIVNYK